MNAPFLVGRVGALRRPRIAEQSCAISSSPLHHLTPHSRSLAHGTLAGGEGTGRGGSDLSAGRPFFLSLNSSVGKVRAARRPRVAEQSCAISSSPLHHLTPHSRSLAHGTLAGGEGTGRGGSDLSAGRIFFLILISILILTVLPHISVWASLSNIESAR